MPLKEIHDSNRCLIGAHLHPWVNPPHDEQVSRYNSLPGNLDRELENAKLGKLVDVIETNLGVKSKVYEAGRYGLGPNTPRILDELDFEVDLSGDPPFNYRPEGPDYSSWKSEPYWFGEEYRLLGIPCTGSFIGFMRTFPKLYRFAQRQFLQKLRVQGIFSRLNVIDRLRLSPEYYESNEHVKLTNELLKSGVRSFTFSFHSPSLKPGCTPFVRDEAELGKFLDKMRRYFDFFFGKLGGKSMTALEFREFLLRLNQPKMGNEKPDSASVQ